MNAGKIGGTDDVTAPHTLGTMLGYSDAGCTGLIPITAKSEGFRGGGSRNVAGAVICGG